MKVLIFGGTGDARDIAERLVALGHDVTTSMAGKTQAPVLPKGNVRAGGFGSVARLRDFIQENRFDWIIDALHPYAVTMSGNLIAATKTMDVRVVRLARPDWEMPPTAIVERFTSAADAITSAPEAARLLITSGHQDLDCLKARSDCTAQIRLIEPPETPLPANASILLDRPPYTLEGEVALMQGHAITHLITKDGGSTATRGKIDAAAELGVTICLITRPEPPDGRWVASVDEIIALVQDSAL